MGKRLLGVIMLAFGLMLTYLCVVSPLADADEGKTEVSLSLKGALLCPLAVVMGLVYVAMGDGVTGFLGTREQPKGAAYIWGTVMLLLGFMLYIWLKSELSARGYETK